jgi:UDP-glucose 4-epimerase
MEILVTGAGGFVGRQLAQSLQKRHGVLAMSRVPAGFVDEVLHDFRQPLSPTNLPPRIDAVVHAAALVGGEARDSVAVQRVNVDATLELAHYALAAGARTFTFFSTGGVYAPSAQPLTEGAPVGPADLYSQSKLDAERLLREFQGRMHVQIVRPFFPYGRAQRNRLIPKLIETVRAGRPVRLDGGGEGPRVSPIYIDDLVEQACRLVELPRSIVANAGGGECVTIRRLATMLGELLGRAAVFEDVGQQVQGANWCGSSELIASLTGHAPQVSLAAGLRHCLDIAEVAT